MEKDLIKVGSIKARSFWISKKAKEEFFNITENLTTFSSTVEEKAKWVFNKLKGKPAKLVVYLPSACKVTFKDSSVIRYTTWVKAILLSEKLMGIEGMKTKVLVWVKVTNMAVEGYKSDKISFTVDVKKSRAKNAYDMPRDAIRVEEY
ncbi:hypothetical protein LguiA_002367 [Lonicera macranthoides]